MTEQEKKLMDLLEDADYVKDGYGGYKIDAESTSKAIFKAFPQITKKPVKIDVSKLTGEAHLVCDYEIANNIDKFGSEYYVEVINE